MFLKNVNMPIYYFLPLAPRGVDFRKNIHRYNNALAFTSIGMNLDPTLLGARGLYVLRLNGRVYHLIGSLYPDEGQNHNFAQIYILDDDDAVNARLQRQAVQRGNTTSNLNPHTMRILQTWLNEHNPYVHIYRNAHQRFLADPNLSALCIRQVQGGRDPRVYNTPTTNTEVAAVIIGSGDRGTDDGRDFWVHRQADGAPTRMPEINHAFMPLHFVLIHPTGADGWHAAIPLRDQEYRDEDYPLPFARQQQSDAEGEQRPQPVRRRRGRRNPHNDFSNVDGQNDGLDENEDPGNNGDDLDDSSARAVTMLRFIRYHLHEPPGEFSILLHSRRLFQEYIIDQYAQIEWCRLRYLRTNQTQLRSHTYSAIQDASSANIPAEDIGKSVILPSTFIGSERQMAQLYQDAMAIVRKLGNPSYFITMTCNPNWPEIVRALGPTEKSNDRPDLVARVFNMKLKALLHDLHNREILGDVIGRVHTIEFQKRGLPHAHILSIVAHEFRPRTPTDIDDIVCAEIPDQVTDPLLYETVTTCMLHGHCTSQNQCHIPESQTCKKRFPHSFREETSIEGEGYPKYRRRDDGRTVTKLINNQPKIFNNTHVVSYNPGFSRKYNCHINVEATTGVAAVKYIYKYIYKGSDRARVEVRTVSTTVEEYCNSSSPDS